MNKINLLKKIILKNNAQSMIIDYKNPCHKWLLHKKVENSFIIIKKYGKPILLKTSLEYFESKEFRVINIKNRNDFLKNLRIHCGSKICVDFNRFTLNQKKALRDAKLFDVGEDLTILRSIKEKKELDNLRYANKLTAKCFNELIKNWNKFKHERDVIKFIKLFAVNNNLDLAFDTIVASGINAAQPHHSMNTKLKKGFCVIDFGFDYKGYKADMTRTIYLGTPSKQEKKIYNDILKVQEQLIFMSIPGTPAKELDMAARILLREQSKYFTHMLGHGTGLEIHELPRIGTKSKDILKENQVITIEPGIYDKKRKLGIRIEDSLIVKKEKPEVLTKDAKKELIIKKI